VYVVAVGQYVDGAHKTVGTRRGYQFPEYGAVFVFVIVASRVRDE